LDDKLLDQVAVVPETLLQGQEQQIKEVTEVPVQAIPLEAIPQVVVAEVAE
jgi:hypothetical protein